MNEPPRLFRVVSNEAGHYSVWAADQAVPDGWMVEGMVGDEQPCLDWIEAVWTDPS